MNRTTLFRRSRPARGAPPGTLAPPQGAHAPILRWISYGPGHLEEGEARDAAELPMPRAGLVLWVDVQGLGDGKLVQAIGERFELHPLAVADTVNTGQRPKVEEYGDVAYVVLRMLERNSHCSTEQFSLFVLPHAVISFQEVPGDCLDPLRQRLRAGRIRLREEGSGYLACMMIDGIVDDYFLLLEQLGERLEELEMAVVERPSPQILQRVYRLKHDLLGVRRSVWPVREMLATLMRLDCPRFGPVVQPYLRDAADHALQVADVLETYREVAASYLDVYLSSVSQRTNDTMRVLTVIATIFIPLTFLAGVYGMNFEQMPELHEPWGYPAFWAVSGTLGGVLLYVFWRVGWLGTRRH